MAQGGDDAGQAVQQVIVLTGREGGCAKGGAMLILNDIERLSNDPGIAAVCQGQAEREVQFAGKHGLQTRNDVQRLRRIMSQPGWYPKLDKMLQAGGIGLPGSS